MKVTLIGHAGFLVETSVGGLLLDPWLFGSAFGDAWDLLEPSFVPDDLWDRVRWIWFSHEHPDHFHPPSLKSIPVERRREILVLFQRTLDGRVRDWLTGSGFSVRELEHGRSFSLGPGSRVVMEGVAIYDSWLLLQDDTTTLLDLNDCAVGTHSLARIASSFPRPDVLITQFSYANWPGNPSNSSDHRRSAEAYLDKLERQTRILRPAAVIPAASFIRFSHVENSWMNRCRATIPEAVDRIAKAGSRPVVMAPGDVWQVGAPWDTAAGIRHYNSVWDVKEQPLHRHDSVPTAAFDGLGRALAERLRNQNNRLLMSVLRVFGMLRPITFLLTDHQVIVEVDPLKGARVLERETLSTMRGDIALHSSALKQLLSSPWGVDALIVAGRFESMGGDLVALHNSFSITSLNNAGIHVRLRSLASPYIIRKLIRIGMPWYRWKREQTRRRRPEKTSDGLS